MSDQAIKNPRIKQGWLRVVLFGGAFCLITLLIAIPAVLFIAGVRKEDLQSTPIQTLSGLLTGNYLWLMLVLECVISLITVGIFRVFVDRKSLMSLGWGLDGYWVEAVTGLLMGPALLGISALLLLFSGHLEWTDIVWDGSQLFISLGLMVLIAFSEELVFRGYILGNLLDSFSGERPGGAAGGPSGVIGGPSAETGRWTALVLSAILFAAFHAINPGIHTLAFANLFLAGLLLGVNYIYTRNLWFSFLFHISWNFFQGPLLGFKVSGLSLPSVLQAETKGDLFITGGDFGLEGSMLNTAVSLTAFLILVWAFGRKYQLNGAPVTPKI
jgi:membrane protease YdiL (CAAX protease family)